METKILALLMTLFTLTLTGCGDCKTTNTKSNIFKTLNDKQIFLEKYVSFKRKYSFLEFHISYNDGSCGIIPSPTEWDIKIFATVPIENINDWSDGLVKKNRRL